MQNTAHLLRTRRFLPIFITQFLGAFNDNLFRTAMVLLVIYGIYRDAAQEAAFSAIAGALFILPFFLLSALAGQLADSTDKARIVRIVLRAMFYLSPIIYSISNIPEAVQPLAILASLRRRAERLQLVEGRGLGPPLDRGRQGDRVLVGRLSGGRDSGRGRDEGEAEQEGAIEGV